MQTINPGMFQIGPSRDESPGIANMMFNTASPNALFSTPSSDSNETFGGNNSNNNNWTQGMGHNPAWSNDFNNQFTSPSAMAFTPSPIVNGASPVTARNNALAIGRSPLHIAPIATKSRVETQINIIMTFEKPPPGVEYLHLPLHTIAKSKLLAKEEYDLSRALELHTMLVCTSAMRNPQLQEKALRRAALQDNTAIQNRADLYRGAADDDKNDMKNVDEADKPANGGEVRICNNCIQRERKRAGRKKLKKEEEQQHWERFETERVVVFNSNEYLQFKPWEPIASDNASIEEQPYTPPEGAIQVSAAMRIACYCRHQSEKEGFRVIFTLKDQQGHVAAQQISDSILITDDHKTHPPSFSASMPAGEAFYQTGTLAGAASANRLPTSYSMVDLSQQVHPFTSSRSTGNLQAMSQSYAQGFSPHSHVHHMPQQSAGFASQTTSTTMTPTSLSRPASPTSIGQSGPNKKRKSSTFHRRVPSGLTMTPRVDTSQPPASNLPSAMSMPSPFSPTAASGFSGSTDQGYMAMASNGGATQYFGSGPPTPSTENNPYAFNQAQLDNLTRAQNAQAYFSHPSSRVPSRASSPVLQGSRANMAAYGRNPIQTPTNSIQGRPQGMYGIPQAYAGVAGGDLEQPREQLPGPPTITKITPAEGPMNGGTEVSIYGYNFTNGMQVMFGEQLATTVFYGTQALLATSPPSRPGGVNVTLIPPAGGSQHASPSSQRQIFTYTQTNPRIMEMALRFLSQQQQTGNQTQWNQFSNDVANTFGQTQGQTGMRGSSGYDGGNMMAVDSAENEKVELEILDSVDISQDLHQPSYDMQTKTRDSMLSLACALDMHQVAAALLARGANADVRDVFGFTPLMHAALHGRSRIAQLLIVKGADHTIRSLKGASVLDLVPQHLRAEFQHMLQNTPRSRVSRPFLGSCVSFGQSSGPNSDWDIASASFYESETDGVGSRGVSRRPSTQSSALPATSLQKFTVVTPVSAPSMAMQAWRDALTTQIQQFQQSMHCNLSSLGLLHSTAFPRDLYADPLDKRQSSITSEVLCPHEVQVASPPPAYSVLFPEKTESLVGNLASDKAAQQSVFCSTAAGDKCATGSADTRAISSSPRTPASEKTRLEMFDSSTIMLSAWLWVCTLSPAEPLVTNEATSRCHFL